MKKQKSLSELINELHEYVGQVQKARENGTAITYLAFYEGMGKELCDNHSGTKSH